MVVFVYTHCYRNAMQCRFAPSPNNRYWYLVYYYNVLYQFLYNFLCLVAIPIKSMATLDVVVSRDVLANPIPSKCF